MAEAAVFEKLLDVLNRLDGRLQAIEARIVTGKAATEDKKPVTDPKPVGCSSIVASDFEVHSQEIPLDSKVLVDHACFTGSSTSGQNNLNNQGTWPSPDACTDKNQPTTQIAVIDVEVAGKQAGSASSTSLGHNDPGSLGASIVPDASIEGTLPATQNTVDRIEVAGNEDCSANQSITQITTQNEHLDDSIPPRDLYAHFPATRWDEAAFGPMGLFHGQAKDAWNNEILWNTSLREFWTVPADNRIDLSFQKHVLRCIPPDSAQDIISKLGEWLQFMDAPFKYFAPEAFSIRDFNQGGKSVLYLPFREKSTYENLGSELNLQESRHEMSKSQKPEDEDLAFGFPIDTHVDASESIIAPWRRFIYIRGLTSSKEMKKPLLAVNSPGHSATPHPAKPFLPSGIDPNQYGVASQFRSTLRSLRVPLSSPQTDDLLRRYFIEDTDPPVHILHAVTTLHASASLIRRDEGLVCFYAPALDSVAMSFHMVLYNSDLHGNILENERWPNGQLYHDGPLFRREALSIIAICNGVTQHNFKADHQFYTILFMVPNTYLDGTISLTPQNDRPLYMRDAVLLMTRKLMRYAVSRWQIMIEHFDDILDDGNTFMNPSNHDSLLVDDETFSGSRKYFWALTCLSNFKACLEDSIATWDMCRETWMTKLPDEVMPRTALSKQTAADVDELSQKLKLLHARFQEHYKNVTALRDGLFNASAVMESRASTKLGENVKLLTYVSIFFLPLAFSTSLFALFLPIESHVLVPTTILIAFATYLLVFNLTTFVRFLSSIHSKYRRSLATCMQDDSTSESWRHRGKNFKKFKSEMKRERKPSDWLLLVYLLRMAWSAIWPGNWKAFERRRATQGHDSLSSSLASGDSDGSAQYVIVKVGIWARIIGLLRKRSEDGESSEVSIS
ncbi:uncharacterized protein BP5553_01663 [Venustampulla echinocandica]|uniref:Uncharacterized protein n=1 Tax=Venustampulla echinocandica TaxID=2656787 RepID=A0A370U1N3_9HELO|nr:uncharacterized protein BP5553_01663 [Venustampulla echinocandica]RDL41684.1 hypothetical protein BP5553_01663 [Venustampulla echinocandica]